MAETFGTLGKYWKNYLEFDDLYCSQPPGGDQDILTSLLGSSHVIRLYLQLMNE